MGGKMNRRTVLAGAGSIGLASLAGCLGLAGLDSHESQPAGVDARVREETGYEQTAIETIDIEEELSLGPYSETISAANHLTEHEKAVDMGPLGRARGAMFVILTTPQVSVVGREFNPVEEMSTDELVELVADNYDGMRDVSHVDDADVTILDQETSTAKYTASAEFDGQDVDVDVHVTEAVETDDDLLVAIGVYPQRVQLQEEDNVYDLIDGIIEEADESETTQSAETTDDTISEDDLGDSNLSEDDLEDSNLSDDDLGTDEVTDDDIEIDATVGSVST